jgi:hypothetical protein
MRCGPRVNVTVAPLTRAGAAVLNGASTRTVPVKYSAGPFAEGCEPFRLISMRHLLHRGEHGLGRTAFVALIWRSDAFSISR